MKTFDPQGWRDDLERSLIDQEMSTRMEDFLPNAVGNAARSGLRICVYAWLTGLRNEVAPILSKYRDWLRDSIRRNETFGRPPVYFAAMRYEALALASWMLDGANDPALYRATLPMYEAAWAAGENGVPLSVSEIRSGYAADYSRNCVLAGLPAQGLGPWTRTDGPGLARELPEPTEETLAVNLCRANWGLIPADPAVVEIARHALSGKLAGPWLGHGHVLTAALWLNAVYFVGGLTTDAEATLLRAYALMPGITPPRVE